jgi:hypothetical protein
MQHVFPQQISVIPIAISFVNLLLPLVKVHFLINAASCSWCFVLFLFNTQWTTKATDFLLSAQQWGMNVTMKQWETVCNMSTTKLHNTIFKFEVSLMKCKTDAKPEAYLPTRIIKKAHRLNFWIHARQFPCSTVTPKVLLVTFFLFPPWRVFWMSNQLCFWQFLPEFSYIMVGNNGWFGPSLLSSKLCTR